MKKLLKIAGAVVVVLLAVALIVPIALRGKIGEIVKREANGMLTARLDFEKLDISLLRHFPNASVDLKGLTLVAQGRFEGDTVVAARRISVVVDLLSLFGDSFEVKKVLLDRPSVLARKTEDGAVNWDVMKPSDAGDSAAGEPQPDAGGASAFRLALRDVRIDDAVLRYADDSSHTAASVAPLSLRLRGDLSSGESELRLELEADDVRLESDGMTWVSGLDASLRADLAADLAAKRFTFSDNRLRLNAIELTLDGWVALPGDAVAMNVRLAAPKIGFRDILSLVPAFYTRDFKQLDASGEMSFTAWAKGEMRDNRMPAFEVALDVRDGSFRYARLPQTVTGIRLAARAANPGGTADATTLDVSDFGLTLAGNSLRASLHAATPMSDLQFRAAAEGRVDLGAIREVYPLDDSVRLGGTIVLDLKAEGRMSDLDARRVERMKASGSFTVEGMQARLGGLPAVEVQRAVATVTPGALTLGECRIAVGRSDLEAKGSLTGYLGYLLRGDRLGGRLYLRSGLLDLNELLGVAGGSETKSEEPAMQTGADSGPQRGEAVAVPANLDLDLEASLDKVLFERMVLTDFKGSLSMKNSTLSMNSVKMNAFGGSLSASGSYSTAVSVEAPVLKMTLGFHDASFSQTFEQLDLVRRMVPLFQKTGGNYSLDMKFRTLLAPSMEPEIGTLDASGELRSSNIRLQNLEVFDRLAEALKNDRFKRIEAGNVRIRFTIADGRLATQPFDIRLGDASVNLSGTTGLDQSIDYTARVTLPASMSGALSHVNVGIGGTFSSPKITVDVKEALREGVSNAVNEQIQKLTGSENLSAEIERQAEKLRGEACKAGEKLVAAAEEQKAKMVAKASGRIAKIAAEKAGDALVAEARKQAANLEAEAERQIEILRSGR